MSPLVSCLEQLGDDAWCNALLPLLVKAKVAGALALTCSQLRAICQRCTKQLNLTQLSACSSTAQVESWTAHLPDRFSNCTHIKLAFSEADHYVNIPALLPALARWGARWSAAASRVWRLPQVVLAEAEASCVCVSAVFVSCYISHSYAVIFKKWHLAANSTELLAWRQAGLDRCRSWGCCSIASFCR